MSRICSIDSVSYNRDRHPYPAMKFSLALVLASLSVLTVAERSFVRRHKQDYLRREVQPQSNGQQNGANPYSRSGPSVGTPTNSANPKGSTTKSSGWVQNPQGKASFSTYSGCQSSRR